MRHQKMELKVVIIPSMKKNNETENLEQAKSAFDTILEETRQISVWSRQNKIGGDGGLLIGGDGGLLKFWNFDSVKINTK